MNIHFNSETVNPKQHYDTEVNVAAVACTTIRYVGLAAGRGERGTGRGGEF